MSRKRKKNINYSKGINGTINLLKRLGINGICWFFSIFMLMFALVAFSEAGVLAGILFIIGAIAINPLFEKLLINIGLGVKKAITIPTLIVTMFAGIFTYPSTTVSETDLGRNIAVESEIEENELVVNNEGHQVLGLSEDENEETVSLERNVDNSFVDENNEDKDANDKAVEEAEKEEKLRVAEEAKKKEEALKSAEETKKNEVIETAEETKKEESEQRSIDESVIVVETPVEETTTQPSNGGRDGSNFDTYDNAAQQQTSESWVLNTKSHKIHYPSCKDVKKISPENYSTSSLSVAELQANGYTGCGHCFK